MTRRVQVSRLESRLGIRLLQRTTRRMQLTEAGARYCERARTILESIESVEREAESVQEAPHGTLRVTAPTVLGQVRVMPVVLAFQHAHPTVKVHADFSDRRFDLIEEGIDVAVRITAQPPPAFVARRLDNDQRVLCASPGYLARGGRPRRPAELANHECIVFVAGQPVETWLLRATEDAEHTTPIRISGRLHVNNTHALRQAALAGLGIADLPRYLVEEDLVAGRLEAVLERFVPVGRGVFAIYAPSPYVPIKVRRFVEMLEETFQPGRPHVRPRRR
ncbi:LysR substrate-binding domain-containing protein [Archangium lansingense]|uniref:LysR family transcriptional regulator n=1 Tax=Archangium lansingense TaxID=2995310 RepID=UPI003B7C97E8